MSKRRGKSTSPRGARAQLAAAFEQHQNGALAEADALYAHMLKQAPRIADGWHLWGILAMQTGQLDAALQRLARATDLKADAAPMWSNYGAALEQAERLQEAEHAYSKALELDPDDANMRFNRGLLRTRLRDHAGALQDFSDAASLAPDDAEVAQNLIRAMREAGQVDRERVAAYLERWPDDAALLDVAGTALSACGDLDGALEALERARELAPDDAAVLTNLGATLIRAERAADAIAVLEAALRRGDEQTATQAQLNLAAAHEAQGSHLQALTTYRAALGAAPGPGSATELSALRGLARVIRHCYPVDDDRALRGWLLRCFDIDDIDPQALADACVAQLNAAYALDGDDAVAAALHNGLATDPLLLRYLRRATNASAAAERLSMAIRAQLLRAVLELPSSSRAAYCEQHLALLAALAAHTLAAEHVYSISDAEHEALRAIGRDGDAHGAEGLGMQLLRAAYEPLAGHTLAALFDAASRFDGMAEVRYRLVDAPREEQQLAAAMPSFAIATETTSMAVQDQYEQNPYPRWLQIDRPRVATVEAFCERMRARIPGVAASTVERLFASPHDVLVAGAGTGHEPLSLAAADRLARVTAIDLSANSLAYGARMATDLQAKGVPLAPVEFKRGDLLEVAALGRSFDLITASGVLHHMADPQAGLAALRAVLNSGGLMKLGLYSRNARGVIRDAWAFARSRGWTETADASGIRAFRAAVLAHEAPGLESLLHSDDFYTLSGCRDLVFHACEHQVDLQEVQSWLQANSLRFGGFDLPDASVQRQFLQECGLHEAAHTDQVRSALLNLERWADFEQRHPQSFAGMYIFWAEAC